MEDYLIAFFLFFVLGLVSVVVLVSVNIDKNEIIELLFLKQGGLNISLQTIAPGIQVILRM